MQKYSDFIHNWFCISVINTTEIQRYLQDIREIVLLSSSSISPQNPSYPTHLLTNSFYLQSTILTIKIHLTVSSTVMYNSSQTIVLIDAQVSNTFFPCKYMSLNFLFLIRFTNLIRVVRQNKSISLEFDVMIAHGYHLLSFKFDNKVAKQITFIIQFDGLSINIYTYVNVTLQTYVCYFFIFLSFLMV